MSAATLEAPARRPAGAVPPSVAWRRRSREIALIAAVYLMYSLSRLAAAGSSGEAARNGRAVLDTEQALHMSPEHWLNRVVSAHRVLGVPADYAYATLHYIVTPAVLVWLWRRHPRAYPTARTTLVVATLLALIGFCLFPVAPPRMMPGFVDTMSRFNDVGWWGDSASAPKHLGGLTNEYAAMPSLHVGWAVWCSWQVARHAQRRWMRMSASGYALLTTYVVIGTANHYLLDAVAGLLVMLLAMALVRLFSAARRTGPSCAETPSADRVRQRNAGTTSFTNISAVRRSQKYTVNSVTPNSTITRN
jgi:hypothetical protein